METKLNIAEILKYKPQGTKLYSSACGKCELKEADDKSFKISFYSSKFGFMTGGEGTFGKNGNLYDDGECIIFPSKEMRDWSKFAWKKGDVLVSNDGDSHIIFKGFSSVDYTAFEGRHWISVGEKSYIFCLNMQNTQNYHVEDDKKAAQTYINIIEKRLGGKLNLNTLEIEKAQPEFKDGDIVTQGVLEGVNVYIIKNCTDKVDNKYNYCARYNIQKKKINYDDWSHISPFAKFATDSEKQQLFEALAKENKAWDAEKKMIVDLNPKVEFKPFDKVLVRDLESATWRVNLFSHIGKDKEYHCVWASWVYCIPYEGNEHLLGTTKNIED